VTSPTQSKSTAAAPVGGDSAQLVPDRAELQRVSRELGELRASVNELRAEFDRRLRQLEAELDEERTARRQLVTDVDRLKKTMNANKRRPF